MNALRISPKYASRDWRALDPNASKDWSKAADMIKDRLAGRFLGFATKLMRFKHSGFIVLVIDSLLAETMQQFEDGCSDRA